MPSSDVTTIVPSIWERMDGTEAEQVLFGRDRHTGLQLVTIIDNTVLGPSLGGIRMYPYASAEKALDDGFRLAHNMTLKSAVAGLDLGGSTTLILGDPAHDKSETLLRTVGRYLAALSGRFVAINDIGTTFADIEVIEREGAPVCLGDPSPYTARGVVESMRAVREFVTGEADLDGVHVAVQGIGNVGYLLIEQLLEAGATVTAADPNAERAKRLAETPGVRLVDPAALLTTRCDILAPCAMGSVVTDNTIDRLNCDAIVAGANNVIERPDLEERLTAREITYVPDFLSNAGGVIFCEGLLRHADDQHIIGKIRTLRASVTGVLRRAADDAVPATQAARRIAVERIDNRRHVYPPYLHP